MQLKKHSSREALKMRKTCTFIPLEDNISDDVVNISTT